MLYLRQIVSSVSRDNARFIDPPFGGRLLKRKEVSQHGKKEGQEEGKEEQEGEGLIVPSSKTSRM
jgi:hypothetical protein